VFYSASKGIEVHESDEGFENRQRRSGPCGRLACEGRETAAEAAAERRTFGGTTEASLPRRSERLSSAAFGHRVAATGHSI